MHNLRFILISVGTIAIIMLFLHGLWTNRQKNMAILHEHQTERLKPKHQVQERLLLYEKDQEIDTTYFKHGLQFDDINTECPNNDSLLFQQFHQEKNEKENNKAYDLFIRENFVQSVSSATETYLEIPEIYTSVSFLPLHKHISSSKKEINQYNQDDLSLTTVNHTTSFQMKYFASMFSSTSINQVKNNFLTISQKQEKEQILILHISTNSGTELGGKKLIQSILRAGFQFGNLGRFHYHLNHTSISPVLFSLANMVKPGSFDLINMDKFTTPGISIFMTIPAYGDTYQNFNLMLQSALFIANDSKGIVLNDEQEIMTPQKLEVYKARIRKVLKNINISLN